jgi:hypothetical protein
MDNQRQSTVRTWHQDLSAWDGNKMNNENYGNTQEYLNFKQKMKSPFNIYTIIMKLQ